MRRSSSFLAATLLTCALTAPRAEAQPAPTPPAAQPAPPPAAAPAAPVDPRTRLAGSFVFVGGDRERAALNAAIDRATEGMNFITGPIARGRLRDRNPIYNTVALRFPAGFIEVVYDGRVFRAPESGANAPGRSITNDPIQVSQRINNGQLVQVITSDSGSKRAEMALSADGNTLSMHITITAGALPRPLRYTLTFRRR